MCLIEHKLLVYSHILSLQKFSLLYTWNFYPVLNRMRHKKSVSLFYKSDKNINWQHWIIIKSYKTDFRLLEKQQRFDNNGTLWGVVLG